MVAGIHSLKTKQNMNYKLTLTLLLLVVAIKSIAQPNLEATKLWTNTIESLDNGDNIFISGAGGGIIQLNDSISVDGSIRASKDLYIERSIVADNATVATGDYILFIDISNGDTLRRTKAQAIADLAAGYTVSNSANNRVVTAVDPDNGNAEANLTFDGSTLGVTGNITVTGNVDGRDVSTDGTKLDGIESGADVTDETNVKSSLDGASITGVTVQGGDKVLIQDISDVDNLKTVTASDIAGLADGYSVTNEANNRVITSTGLGTGNAEPGLTFDGDTLNITGTMFSDDILTRELDWLTSYPGDQERILSLTSYNGKLYAGQGSGAGDGDILVFDGSSWTTSYDGNQENIFSLASYNGKLYAGQGSDAGDGDILVFDGSSWTTSYDGDQEIILSLASYNGKLYAGQGNSAGDGDILVFDGSSWTTSYDGSSSDIYSLASYNGKLYAGQGSGAGDGDILVFDGSSWTTSYDGNQERIFSLTSYNGKLYAGQGFNSGDGDILVFDGSSWTTSYDGNQERILSLTSYNGKLYAGQGNSAGDGDILVFDGSSWTTSYDGSSSDIFSLTSYNGKLYAGQGSGIGDGDIFVYSEKLENQLYNPSSIMPITEQPQWFAQNVSFLDEVNFEDTIKIETALIKGIADTDSVLVGLSGGILDTIGIGDGLVLENRTLSTTSSTIQTEGTYTPSLTADGTNPTVSYSTRSGYWEKTGEWITVSFYMSLGSVSGGSGVYRITLPESSNNFIHIGLIQIQGVDLGYDHYDIFVDIIGSRNNVKIQGTTGATPSSLTVTTDLSNSNIIGTIRYKVN